MKKIAKVAIVAHGLSDGGAERVASILANYLNRQEYIVTYVCAYSEQREYFLNPTISIKNIHTDKNSKIGRLWDRNVKIYRILKEENPDCVISFITNELILSEIKRIPIVFSLRNDPSKVDGSGIASVLRRFAYARAKAIVFQATGAKKYFSEKIQDKGVVIANPLETQDLPYLVKEKCNHTFITACRLNKQKNIPMLIDAFVSVHKDYPEYDLQIYGDGELYKEINRLIRDRKAESYIKLMGHSKNIHEIMAHSYAFILSSDYEGLSNSMLEALCIGIPVVCTDCPPGGAREFIKNNKNGLLSPVGDSEKMAEQMKLLIRNPRLACDFSAYADRTRNMLQVDTIGEKWVDILHR